MLPPPHRFVASSRRNMTVFELGPLNLLRGVGVLPPGSIFGVSYPTGMQAVDLYLISPSDVVRILT